MNLLEQFAFLVFLVLVNGQRSYHRCYDLGNLSYRLQGKSYAGLVEVNCPENDQWLPLCKYDWNSKYAAEVCKTLNFTDAGYQGQSKKKKKKKLLEI